MPEEEQSQEEGIVVIDGEKYAGTNKTAEIVGVSLRRIQALIEERRLPAKKVGRDYWVKVADAERERDREKKGGWPKGKLRKPPKSSPESPSQPGNM